MRTAFLMLSIPVAPLGAFLLNMWMTKGLVRLRSIVPSVLGLILVPAFFLGRPIAIDGIGGDDGVGWLYVGAFAWWMLCLLGSGAMTVFVALGRSADVQRAD